MKGVLKNNKQATYLFVVLLPIFLVIIIFALPRIFSDHYVIAGDATIPIATSTPKEVVFVPSYVSTPEPVRGIYMTSWVASNEQLRGGLVKLIDETEINTLVIDIKDYSGKIVFKVSSPELKNYGSEEIRIKDLQDFIETLHKKNIYVVGRVAVFQDAYFVKHRPDLAVKTEDKSAVWKDRKGISWIDPGSKEYWDYIILLAKESRKLGFDEINFDYIRFPSDGNMQDISYPFSSSTTKAIVMKNFFEYLHNELIGTGLKTSADLFGMTTSANDDMGIGQLLENTLPYFDYIMPMVYPSHYPPTFEGFSDPEKYPYEVVKYAMKSAVDRSELLASTTGQVVGELRPWLQDFGLKMSYGATEVRAQIKATNDVGLSSWILWSPSNKYTKGALNPN
ncbi:MAG: Uncharacterized protein CEO12_193 [Parcubacteria group bacterium Gr01-1014_46]|nr:MAG: Uncharacterized protein CEO12_193 [Parcubacteria group bacterium Gr01-1014_46]